MVYVRIYNRKFRKLVRTTRSFEGGVESEQKSVDFCSLCRRKKEIVVTFYIHTHADFTYSLLY